MRVIVFTAVVLAGTHRVRIEDDIEVVLAVSMGPFLDNAEHLSVAFIPIIPDGRMVEYTADVVEDLVDWDVGMIPCVHHARCNVHENLGSDLTSRFVQNVGKVVLGKHGVGWVRAGGDGPDFELVFCSGLHHC